MFNAKSTIYQTEWLDLIFANRNKGYGAYELRENYNRRLTRALCIASFSVTALLSYPFVQRYLFQPATELNPLAVTHANRVVNVSLPPLPKKQEVRLIIAETAPTSKKQEVKTVRFVEPIAVRSQEIQEPFKNIDLTTAVICSNTSEGTSPTTSISDDTGNGNETGRTGTGTGPADQTIYTPGALERYPEFPGGMEAFAKYLRKNLRYPQQAREAEVGGKVLVSFVVEKDGRLTDIKVVRGIGYGCDEEAARVLQKSPAWKAGIQNNIAVRVLYTIPLIFQLEQ